MWRELAARQEDCAGLGPGRVLEWIPWDCRPLCTNPLKDRAAIHLRPGEADAAEKVLAFLEDLLAPYQDAYGDGWATYLPVLRQLRLVRDQSGWQLESEDTIAVLEKS